MSRLFNIPQYYLRLLIITLFSKFFVNRNYKLEQFGRKGASWWVPRNILSSKSIVYSGGVGEDISFDTELIKACNCQVFALDPTPRAAAYANKFRQEKFYFYPIGLWKKDSMVSFFAPVNPSHVSHSAVNLQNTSVSFRAPCLTLGSMMKKLGHRQIDLLKLDIEGAEFAVLDQMLKDEILPTSIAVEFDQPCSVSKMISYVFKLHYHGYDLIKQDYFNFTFIKE